MNRFSHRQLDELRASAAWVVMATAAFASVTACKRPPQLPPPAPPATLKATEPPPVPDVQLGDAPRLKDEPR